jgi:putative transposase
LSPIEDGLRGWKRRHPCCLRKGCMPRRPRVSTAGLFFHVINRSAKRARLFHDAVDYIAFERVLAEAIARSDMSLFAYCAMPNHWHLLLSPQRDGGLSRFMHWLTTTHARRWQTARALDGQGAVYQGRFKAIPIGDDRHFLWVCRYVERNPLRAGFVERAEDWPWSSLGRFVAEPDTPWLTRWPGARPTNWIEQVNSPQTEAELEAFRRAMTRGTAFGDEDWCRAVNARLGTLKEQPRGRPWHGRRGSSPG